MGVAAVACRAGATRRSTEAAAQALSAPRRRQGAPWLRRVRSCCQTPQPPQRRSQYPSVAHPAAAACARRRRGRRSAPTPLPRSRPQPQHRRPRRPTRWTLARRRRRQRRALLSLQWAPRPALVPAWAAALSQLLLRAREPCYGGGGGGGGGDGGRLPCASTLEAAPAGCGDASRAVGRPGWALHSAPTSRPPPIPPARRPWKRHPKPRPTASAGRGPAGARGAVPRWRPWKAPDAAIPGPTRAAHCQGSRAHCDRQGGTCGDLEWPLHASCEQRETCHRRRVSTTASCLRPAPLDHSISRPDDGPRTAPAHPGPPRPPSGAVRECGAVRGAPHHGRASAPPPDHGATAANETRLRAHPGCLSRAEPQG
mmetsp:Transcript_4346/g.14095  ORF Transcript_4346/g.14095 Transcript_4346/m.14095 type:complete len:369 (-) Transcript_4346:1030-2136(-)